MEIRRSKFHFVDLAGSERAKRTGASGQRFKEVRELVLQHAFAVECREAVGRDHGDEFLYGFRRLEISELRSQCL